MLFKKTLLAVAAFAFVGVASAATTPPSTFNVKLIVTSNCKIKTSPIGDIDLGSVAAGEAVTAGTTTIAVNCSKATTFKVGLTPSNSSTTGAGSMTNAVLTGTPIPYQLHQTSAAGSVWGNVTTGAGNTMGGTGAGMEATKALSFTAYATVATADTNNVELGTYNDVVSVVVTY